MDKIASLGLQDLILELWGKGYTSSQISDYLTSQGFDISKVLVGRFLKSQNLEPHRQKVKVDYEYLQEFDVINPVELLDALAIPTKLDTQEKAIEALQKAHIQTTFDIWAIFHTYLQKIKNGENIRFPTEIAKSYFMAVKECYGILGIDMAINENTALKHVKNLGYSVDTEN